MAIVTNLYEIEDILSSNHINDICESGDNYPACEACYHDIDMVIPKDRAIGLLLEYGAWSLNELQRMTTKDLKIKLIWIAAWNIADR